MSYPVPKFALDDRLAFVGISGSGKTYCAGTAVERLLTSGARLVIIDPLGVWFGLALDRTGKKPSSFRRNEKLIIFGGPHGDLPLNEQAGALIGETVAGMAESCILDFSDLGTKAAERRFALAFLTALYKHKTREPLHLIFDEADMFAPQRILDKEGEAMKLLGMMETVVRRGRVRGFIPWLISQRPAVISKNVLSQIDGLVAMKLTSSQDRDAIGDWVSGQADQSMWKMLWAKMPTLQRGQGIVWIPGREILKTVDFPEKETFDSSRAPERGSRRRSVKLKPVNIDKLKAKLSQIVVDAKANDPKELRQQVAALKVQLSRATANPVQAVDKKAVEKVWADAHKSGFIDAAKMVDIELSVFERGIKDLGKTLERLRRIKTLAKAAQAATVIPQLAPPRSFPRPQVIKDAQPINDTKKVNILAKWQSLGNPQIRIMQSLLMWQSLGKDKPTREMVAAAAGYKPRSGNFNNIIGGLTTIGAIMRPSQGLLSLGENDVPTNVHALTSLEAASMFTNMLNNPQRKIIDSLLGKGARSRDEVASESGFSPGSGHFNNVMGSLSTIDVVRRPSPGQVELSDWAQELLQK